VKNKEQARQCPKHWILPPKPTGLNEKSKQDKREESKSGAIHKRRAIYSEFDHNQNARDDSSADQHIKQ